MKYLLLNSLLIFVIGCSASYYSRLVPNEKAELKNNEVSSFFYDIKSSQYVASVDAYGYHVSGLFIIKKTGEESYRIGFLTQTGLTIFSFEITPDTFNVNYCLEQLNKKDFINVIEADVRLLLLGKKYADNATMFTDPQTNQVVYNLKYFGKSNYLYTSPGNCKLERIESSKRGGRDESIDFKGINNGLPVTIVMKHYDFPIEVKLDLIKEEK